MLIGQHDHALLSGWLACAWGNPQVPPQGGLPASLCLAASLHDLGWLELDRHPPWSREAGRPYSFQDLPAELRLPAYVRGVDRVEGEDAYAGLLCSRHYSSFVAPHAQEGAAFREYLAHEEARQARIQAEVGAPEEEAEAHLALLQLLDALSLYVCLNEPGAGKGEEHPWYREGFPTARLPGGGSLRLQARWLDPWRVELRPFPLRAELACALAYRRLPLGRRVEEGWPEAYLGAAEEIQVLRFVPPSGPRQAGAPQGG